MALKTYVLLDHLDSSANVYLQVNAHERIKFKKRPVDHAYGQISFRDRDGKQKTIRLKLGCDEIDLHRQVKEYMIPANEKFTQEERDALRFRDGVRMTEDEVVQRYLETSPQFEDFWKKDEKGRVGSCPSITGPMYKLYDKGVELKANNETFRKRLAAANRIDAINTVEEGAELLLRVFGSFHKVPDDVLEIRSQLIDFLDEADDKQIDILLREQETMDEKVSVLVGKALNLRVLSFDKKRDMITMIKNGKQVDLRQIPSAYTQEQRLEYFVEFLTSEDGKAMLQDIRKEVAEAGKNKT
jgi:hypothetical protein